MIGRNIRPQITTYILPSAGPAYIVVRHYKASSQLALGSMMDSSRVLCIETSPGLRDRVLSAAATPLAKRTHYGYALRVTQIPEMTPHNYILLLFPLKYICESVEVEFIDGFTQGLLYVKPGKMALTGPCSHRVDLAPTLDEAIGED